MNATKDKLFSIIAHDLRSPFNSILGFSELLIENLKDFEISESEKYVRFINSSAQNTLVLLDNLLNWAKSQTGQIAFNPQKISLSSLISEVIEQSNSAAIAKEISLIHKQADEIEAYADEDILKTVLRNLISNAIKFTKVGGCINIVVITEQKHVEISISDNGIGINEEKLKTLFNISSNTTSLGTANEKGSGLGLVLCKEFVEKLGGSIWVESEERIGSNFKFTLPYCIGGSE
ncbi:sensor histidine kinase [Ancylomarina sp. YFZ004]